MESLQGLKSRLKAVRNVGQITKAMEVVAATKMRKAQEQALGSRPYAFAVLRLLEKLSRNAEIKSPLLVSREIKKTLLVVIASDRGLAGSFNSQIFRLVDGFLKNDELANNRNHEYLTIGVGKKAVSYVGKKNYSNLSNFDDFGDITDPREIEEIVAIITNGYSKNEFDRVIFFYTNFRSALKQEALSRQLLPADFEKIRQTLVEVVPEYGRFSQVGNTEELFRNKETDYLFEPAPARLIEALVPHLIRMQVYHIFLEAKASEHSARRLAMKTASDNAEELSADLQLEYNKLRQTKITGELMEITGTLTTLS